MHFIEPGVPYRVCTAAVTLGGMGDCNCLNCFSMEESKYCVAYNYPTLACLMYMHMYLL